MTPLDILQKYWGHQQFRKSQEEIIRSVLDGKDTLAILPTGGGKSVCFQVPAMAMEGRKSSLWCACSHSPKGVGTKASRPGASTDTTMVSSR